MLKIKKLIANAIFVGLAAMTFLGCGEEYYSTPEKTLARYVDNRFMGTMMELEATLNCFRKEDRKWWDESYEKLCWELYQQDCPGPGLSSQTTLWTDLFEPAGPAVAEPDSVSIDGDTAVMEVDGMEIELVKERGNWKIVGFFGVQEELEKKYATVLK